MFRTHGCSSTRSFADSQSVKTPARLFSAGLALTLGLGLSPGCSAMDRSNAAGPQEAMQTRSEETVLASAAVAPGDTIVVDAQGLQDAFQAAAASVKPSVVSIVATKTVQSPFSGMQGHPLERFFGPGPRGPQEQSGIGSGVIIDDQGHILTNAHVVADAKSVEVELHDERKVEAEIVGTDPRADLAVIKVATNGLDPAPLGSSGQLKVGQWVLAVGSPFGLRQTVSAGIVSATGRGSVGIADYEDFIQTDAAVNPGNSGGPLIDLQGRVVGVNTAIASRSGGSNGIGFAIPIDMARGIAKQLIEQGEVVRGWIGVLAGEIDAKMAKSFGYDGDEGLLVQDVVPGGPAAKAGLEAGDVIVSLNGEPTRDMARFRNAVAAYGPGEPVELGVWRDGKTRTLQFELGRLPSGPDEGGALGGSSAPIGIGLGDAANPQLRAQLGYEATQGAVIVQVQPGSVAAKAGLRPGDVIVEVQGKAVDTAAEAKKHLGAGDLERGIRIRIRRGEFGQFVLLESNG